MSREPTDSDQTRNIEPLRPGVDSFDFIDEEIDGADSSAFDAFDAFDARESSSEREVAPEHAAGARPESLLGSPTAGAGRGETRSTPENMSERFAELVADNAAPTSPPERRTPGDRQRFDALFSAPPVAPVAPRIPERPRRQSGESERVAGRSQGVAPPPAPARHPSQGMEPLSVRSRRTGSFRLDAAPSEGVQRVVGSPISERDSYSGEVIQLSPRDVVRAKSTSMGTLRAIEVPEDEAERGAVNAVGQSVSTVRRRLARRLKSMAPDEVATIICDDPDIPVGIQDWSLTMGFDVESLFTDELGNWTVQVRRKGVVKSERAQEPRGARHTPRDGLPAADLLSSEESPDRPLEQDAERRASGESSVPYTVFARSADELRHALRAAPHSAVQFSVRATGDASSNVLMRWCLERGHRLHRFERAEDQFVASVSRVPEGS